MLKYTVLINCCIVDVLKSIHEAESKADWLSERNPYASVTIFITI